MIDSLKRLGPFLEHIFITSVASILHRRSFGLLLRARNLRLWHGRCHRCEHFNHVWNRAARIRHQLDLLSAVVAVVVVVIFDTTVLIVGDVFITHSTTS